MENYKNCWYKNLIDILRDNNIKYKLIFYVLLFLFQKQNNSKSFFVFCHFIDTLQEYFGSVTTRRDFLS